MKRILIAVLLAALLLAPPAGAETLIVEAATPLHGMSETLYGLFFEDINHAADGGLYAELLQNRSFENQELMNPARHQHLSGWLFNTSAEGDGKIQVMNEAPLHPNNPTYIRIEAVTPGFAFENIGYSDSAFRAAIPVVAGETYDVSLWLRSVDYEGGVTVALASRLGGLLSDSLTLRPGEEWSRQSGLLRAEASADNACLRITLETAGTLEVDMASLMPTDRVGAAWPGGGLRPDLVEALRELRPSFLRFPGGCVTEGSWVWDNLYRWKDTVGPVEQRKENWNTWGYMQSYGLGFYEYFCLCEEIGALPLPVVGSGVLCQAREPAEAPMDDAALAEWTQDILDLLEFALGGTDTVWGGLRAEMGHEAPFDLRFLAIGNENWADVYFTRYEKIRAAVKEAWPDITCIVACGPVAEGGLFNASRSKILHSFSEDMADEHYYMDSQWFLRNTHRYDYYPRSTRIFLGEYAAHEPAVAGRRPNNLYSALCEAAYLTGIERNSDVVALCCYAPLMARYGLDQWTPDLIWFDGSRVVRTPNYYIQQMFSSFRGKQLLSSAITGDDGQALRETGAGLYHVAEEADGQVCVKMVNVSGEEKELTLQLSGLELPAGAVATLTVLSGEKQAVNGLNGEAVHPETTELPLSGEGTSLRLPGYAAAVLVYAEGGK